MLKTDYMWRLYSFTIYHYRLFHIGLVVLVVAYGSPQTLKAGPCLCMSAAINQVSFT